MTVGSDHYLVNAKNLFLYGKINANEPRENITDCSVELIQSPVYNRDSLRDERNNNSFITNFNRLNMFRVIISSVLRSTRLVFTDCGVMHRQCCLQAAPSVLYTASCKHKSGAPEDGRNYQTKHVELIEIINKITTFASSWLFISLAEDSEAPTSCIHSLVLLKMEEIISRNMLN